MIHANQRCLGQALGLLDRLDDAQYASPRGTWSAVGAQLRHVIEHYQCFLEGLPDGRIDYDGRRRDASIEASRERARGVLESIRRSFGATPINAARPIMVQMRCNADDPDPIWAASTVGRELQFLISHSIHHFALMKLLLAGDDVTLDEEFGTAPSTAAHARAR